MKRLLFIFLLAFALVHGGHRVFSQDNTPELFGNSPDGSNNSSDFADQVAAEAIHSVLANPDYTAAQKQRIIEAIKSSNEQQEVAETLEASGIEIDHAKEKSIGYVSIRGNFSTTEISGCWTDETIVNASLRIYKKKIGTRDVLVAIEGGERGPTIYHETGPRCGNSDQGPMVTDPGSCQALALGYYDPKAKTYTMMLEGDDLTHWTLKSGGDVGAASFLKFYLPHMNNADAGSLSAFSVSKQQAADGETLIFKGKVSGSGATTTGVVGLMFTLSETTSEQDAETQKHFFTEIQREWQKATNPKTQATSPRPTGRK